MVPRCLKASCLIFLGPYCSPRMVAGAFLLTRLVGKQGFRLYSATSIRRATRLCLPPERPHSLAPFRSHPKLIPESLRATLDAHRDANRAFLIRKIEDPGSTDTPLESKQTSSVGNHDADESLVEGPHESANVESENDTEQQPSRAKRKSLEYEGVSQPLFHEWSMKRSNSRKLDTPWMSFTTSDSTTSAPVSAMDALNQEIKSFEAYMMPDHEELAAADAVLVNLRDVVRKVDPALTASVIGSRANGLARSLSDIDINLSLPDFPDSGVYAKSPWTKSARNKAKGLIRTVQMALRRRRQGQHLQFKDEMIIFKSRVPIASGYHVASGLKYQTQCTTSAQQSLEYAKLYLNEYPSLRPLFIVIHQMLEMRRLTDGSKGGAGSYTILMMIVAALKLSDKAYRSHEVGAQFIDILDFYSTFDFYKFGIIVQPPMLVDKNLKPHVKSEQEEMFRDFEGHHVAILASRRLLARGAHEQRPYLMLLQDPAYMDNDLGANAFKIKNVQATIRDLKDKLDVSMRVWTSFKNNFAKNSSQMQSRPRISLLSSLVGGDYSTLHKARTRVRAFGRKQEQRWTQKHQPNDKKRSKKSPNIPSPRASRMHQPLSTLLGK